MRKHFLGILFLLICCTNYLAAQVDTAFWFAVPSLSEHCYLADYHLMFSSYNEDANVRISMPATPSFTPKTFSIAKHSFYDYVLAADYTSAESTFSVPYHVISQRGLLIESDAPISCYFQIKMQNGEAYTLKGDKALGTDFVLLMQNGHTNGLASTSTLYTNAYSSLQIVATEDNTAVTINPTANSGNSCNTSVINITLNKGETYALRACSKAGASHIAGTVIHSNKPIAVNSTDDTVRPTGGKADLVGDQLVPIDYWDTEYIAVSRRNSFEGLYIFSRASTNVILGDGTIHSLNAGEVLFVSLANKDVEWIFSTEPIGIYHLTGINEVAGTILPGLHCTGSQEIFYKRQAFSVKMLLHIVIRTSNINSMYLNDSQIASSNFHIVNGTGGEWSYANIEVTDLVPLNSSAKISSSNGLFQLGIMDFMRTLDPDNNSVASCTYGYFSNYGTAHEYAEYDSFEDGTIYTCHGHYYPGTTTPMTFYTEGEYTDHLTDINGCDSICVLHLSKMPFPDNVIDVPCTVDPPTNVWSIRRSAISTQDLLDDCSTTMVGDIDGDGQVEIIAPINGESMQYEKIGIFDAQANVKRIINIPGTSIFTNIAVAKVKTGESQYTTLFFFLAYDKYIYAYTPTGTQYWKSNLPFSHNDGELVPIASLSLADFNHDGWSEIYLGSEIFDAATGNKLCAFDGNRGHADHSWKASRQMYQSVAADVIGDSNLELLIGNCACTVNINSRTDATQNSIIQGVVVPTSLMKMEDNSSIPSTDGFTLSADMDGDGKLDAIVMWIDKSNRILYVYIWNPRDGTILGTRKIVNVSEFGTPNIGDIDNDGNLELNFIIGTQPGETTDANDRIFSLKYNKSTHSLGVFWTLHHDDASGATGLTLFDFNQDGTKEIVYRDCENLRIINGSMKHHLTGAPVAAPYDLATIPCTSGTATEYPVIADVDADGEAEIVVVGEWKLQVYKSNLEPWAPARKVWNQYAYNITNVNEDLTIPQYQYNNAHKFTDASSVVRQPYNTFLSQVTTINTQGVPFIAAADVNVSTSTTTTYENDSIKIDLSFCNQGDLQVNAPYCITAYKNAYRGSVLFVDTIKAILPIGDCLSHQVGFPISNVCSDKDINSIVIAVNDDGHGIAQHGNQQAECDTTNNSTSVSLPTDFRSDTTKYTPVICATELPYTFTPTGTIFPVGTTSGRTIIPETNKYGCDSIITIDLTVNPILYGDTFAVVYHTNTYEWYGETFTAEGNYPHTLSSKVTGCDSIVTLHLTFVPYPDNVADVECVVPPIPSNFEIKEIYKVDGVHSMATPLVADLDGDGKTEIICSKWPDEKLIYGSDGFLIIDGITGQAKDTLHTCRYPICGQPISIVDVDGDGKCEIFLSDLDNYAYCYSHTGTLKWKSSFALDGTYIPLLGHLTDDEIPELFFGKYIFNPVTGTLIHEIAFTPNGTGWGAPHGVGDVSSNINARGYHLGALADVDKDGKIEYCAGNTIYKLNISNPNGQSGNSSSVFKQVESIAAIHNYDGQTLIVDFDNDGNQDICVLGLPKDLALTSPQPEYNIYVWNSSTGAILAHEEIVGVGQEPKDHTWVGLSIPYCGDLNGDGFVDLTFSAKGLAMYTYTYDATSPNHMRQVHNYAPFNETCGYTVFDFNMDGNAEIVYRGTHTLNIVDGSTLTPLSTPTEAFSGTVTEYPVVADVNGDGQADIIIHRGNYEWPDRTKIREDIKGWVSVYSAATSGAWSSARSVWNQWAYNSININDDMSVPQYMYDVSAVYPNGTKPFNSFLAQNPIIDQQGDIFVPAADAAVTSCNNSIQNDSIEITVNFCNNGDANLVAPFEVTTYKNAYRGEVIKTDTIYQTLTIGNCTSLTTKIPVDILCSNKEIQQLLIAINDDGHGIAQHGNQQAECDTTNNRTSVSLPTDFRCDTTKYTPVICATELPYTFTPTGTIFPVGTTSGRTIIPETNKYGCDSIITIDLTVNPTLTGDTTATFCNGTPFIWHGTSYPTGGDYPYTYTSKVTGCDSIVTLHLTQLEPTDSIENVTLCYGESHIWHGQTFTTSTTITETIPNAAGCDSVCTLNLTILPALTGDTSATFCNGTPFIWHDTPYATGGDYQYTYTSKVAPYGDSIVTLHLSQLEPTDSVEIIKICAGGSHTWHGRTYTTSTKETEIIPNSVGCDSVCTLNLTILPVLSGTTTATITEGATYTWNDQPYTTSGDYTQNLTTNDGCDSVATLHLIVDPLEYEILMRSHCADDPYIEWEVLADDGLIHQLQFAFSQKALDQHFRDTIVTYTNPVIQIPNSARAGIYNVAVSPLFDRQLLDTRDFQFTLLYPSSVLDQHWDDFIGVLTHDYNGGYDFVGFQWYKDGSPVIGENHSYFYQPLEMGATYSAMLEEADGTRLMTCEIIATPQKEISLYPTLLQPNQIIHLHSSEDVTVWLYDSLGKLLYSNSFERGDSQFAAPYDRGLYFVMIQQTGEQNKAETKKLIVR